MIYFILQCVYFMLPAYFANMMPILVKKINFLDEPINKKLLGSHKTWRGLFFGVIAGIIIAYIQFVLQRYDLFLNLSFFDYSNWLALGFLLGFGALFGDMIKSFFKRRAGIKPGKRFIPWDQLDYSIGSLLMVWIFYTLTWKIAITVIIVNFFLHILVNHVAYYLNLKNVKW